MSSNPNFIVTPMAETVCCTCADWSGARVLLDGYCHSLSDAVGYCQNASSGGIKHIWQQPRKLAPETACEDWGPAETSIL